MLRISSIRSYLIVLSIALFSLSCDKFVEKEEDPSNLFPDNYYTIPEHATASIASGYAQMRFVGGGAGIFVNNFQMLEAVTGTMKTETGQNSDLNNLLGLAYNGDNLLVNNWWNGLYNIIAQANLTLERVPGISPMDEALKNRILGEAKFQRAYAYFYLVRLWGDVPLILTPQRVTSENFFPSKTNQEAVYEQIVKDLSDAENSGLPPVETTGRASRAAVKSLLAKVYLTMAGYPLQKGVPYYELAAAKALEVINSTDFSLFPKYADLHNPALDNRGEHIFQVQYQAGIADNPFQGVILPNFKDISEFGTEIGSCVPTNEFVNSYEPGDLRTVDRVGFFYRTYYDKGNGPLRDLSAPYIYKYFDTVGHGTAGIKGAGNSSLNWSVIRYAEVLLTYAEAQNEADGSPNAQAIAALTSIRNRAKLTTPASFTQEEFRTAVWRERWHELCYENHTWFDMVRLRKAYVEASNSFEEFVGHALTSSGSVLQEKHLLFPLPTSEMQNNPNLKPQNAGY